MALASSHFLLVVSASVGLARRGDPWRAPRALRRGGIVQDSSMASASPCGEPGSKMRRRRSGSSARSPAGGERPREAHVHVLEELDRKQQLGEVVLQRRDDADVARGQLAGISSNGTGAEATRTRSGATRAARPRSCAPVAPVPQTRSCRVREPSRDRRPLAAGPRRRSAGPGRRGRDPQRAVRGQRTGWRRSGRRRVSSGVFMTTIGPAGADAARRAGGRRPRR